MVNWEELSDFRDTIMEPLDFIKPTLDTVIEPLAIFATGNLALFNTGINDLTDGITLCAYTGLNAVLAIPAVMAIRNARDRADEALYGFHMESGWSYLRTATLLGAAGIAILTGFKSEPITTVLDPVNKPTNSPALINSRPISNQFKYNLSFPTKDNCEISSGYGMRAHPITGRRKKHNGVDIACAEGTPIYAAADGIVTLVESDDISGNYVKIQHSKKLSTTYSHLQDSLVSVGDELNRGDEIGTMGSTGKTTGSHLHFILRENGSAVNPIKK